MGRGLVGKRYGRLAVLMSLGRGGDGTVTAPPYVAAMKYGSRTGRGFWGRKIRDGVAVERVA